jgi:hypothetical protein
LVGVLIVHAEVSVMSTLKLLATDAACAVDAPAAIKAVAARVETASLFK